MFQVSPWNLKSIGADVSSVSVEQDNKSSIILLEKGYSTSHRTRHIPIRYFYCKDVILREGVETVFVPTEEIKANGASKPLQGKEWKRYKSYLMGHNAV